MPSRTMLALAALSMTAGTPLLAQNNDNNVDRKGRAGRLGASQPSMNCDGMRGTARDTCVNQARQAAAGGGTPGVSAADGKMFNEVSNAANAKLQARDFAGAAALYQGAIAEHPKSSLLHRLYAGQAIALRQQAVAAYNVEQPVIPPPGSSNDEIKAANASNAGLQARKSAAALPTMRQAQEAAGKAAALAATSKDHGADASIGTELRQSASFLYQLDHEAVLATPRASADLEAESLRKWMASEPAPAADQVARYGIATAATVVAKDPAAGLTLADEVLAKSGGNADGAIGYADLVVAAKAPAGDPRRAKALAALTAAEPTVTDAAKKQQIQKLKTALGGA